ncbi:MAG: YceD family protein [Wenzhouxiangella sp.]
MQPDKAAAARREFSGTMRLDRFERLVGMIADPDDAEVGFELIFEHDDQHQVRVEVAIHGVVPLRCQRTLKVFEHLVDSRSVVGIVADDRAAESLPEDYEPMLCPEGRVELVRLVEEELLLALPLVPVDPESERIEAEASKADTHQPFAELAELAELKRRRDRNE